MNVLKVKRLTEDATLPKKAHPSDSGYDLVAIDDGTVDDAGYLQYRTGLAVEIPEGFEGRIYPRSSISKYDLILANGVGVIDESYRGELLVRFKSVNRWHTSEHGQYVNPNSLVGVGFSKTYKKGDKIAQFLLQERPEFVIEEVTELSGTVRSTGGFGSSGA
jgi:dUTP pyrophosphatase